MYEEVTVFDDNQEKILDEPKFLLMNKVCSGHSPLASTKPRENHAELSKNVLDIIEEVKARNINSLDDRISRETDPLVLHDLVLCRPLVLQHNEKITKEWNLLVMQPHAFDSHIHAQIQKEMNGSG